VYTLTAPLGVLTIEYVTVQTSFWQADNAAVFLTGAFIKLYHYYCMFQKDFVIDKSFGYDV
jgi:hypothetical protein